MILAVETGVTTSVLFVVTLVLYGLPTTAPLAVAIELCVGRTYANTLLYSLCACLRAHFRCGRLTPAQTHAQAHPPRGGRRAHVPRWA
jgi:hypothetical protein